MQHEITASRPLLDAKGNIAEPGFAKSLLPIYRRADVKASGLRLKEWDYYCVSNGKIALCLTIADNGYMGLDSVSLLNLEEGWEITTSPMQILTRGKKNLPETSKTGVSAAAGKGYNLQFTVEEGRRVLLAQMRKFGPEGSLYAKVTLTDEPAESMVIATPFDRDGHFYYNQKINCMRAEGFVTYGYHNTTYEFKPEDRFVYFTGLTGEQKLEIELPAGKQVFTVTMDNGDLFTRIENDTVVLMDEQTTFTDDFILNAPKAGTYILTFTGEDASGSFNYGDPDVASCPGATVVEPVRK